MDAEMAMTETRLTPTEQLAVLETQTATTVIATSIQHQTIVFVSSFLARSPAGNRKRIENSYSRSHDAVIRVCDETRNVIETHEYKGD
jgi:hypothetical protein